MLEEEIDLRPYIVALVKKWWLILITAVVGIGIAYLFALQTKPVFSATTLVTIKEAQDLIELNSGITDLQSSQPLDAFPELALSDEVLAETLNRLGLEEEVTISEFRRSLSAESGSDDSVVRLTATSAMPELSAQTANVWADAFTDWANAAYVGINGERVEFFEGQLEDAKIELQTARQELETFALIDESEIISNTLSAYNSVHLQYVEQKLQVEQIINDADSLKAQIEQRPSTLDITFADQLAYTNLQLATLNESAQIPVILEVANAETLTTADRDEQLQILTVFLETLEDKVVVIDNNLNELEPQIRELQQKRQRFSAERSRLLDGVNVARETVTAIAFQVAEERIASQNRIDGFQIASRAVPTAVTTDEQSPITTIIIGGLLGAMLSSFIVLTRQWWKKE